MAEDTKKSLADIVAALNVVEKRLGKESSEGKEVVDRLVEAMGALTDKLGEQSPRRGEPEVEDARRGELPQSDGNPDAVNAMVRETAYTDEHKRLHRINDDLLIARHIMESSKRDVRTTKMYERYMNELRVLKSVSTAANSMGPWVPTEFSSSLHEQVRYALRVAALHTRIDMPQDPFKLPIEGADAVCYIVNELGDADAHLTSSNLLTASFSGANDPAPTVMTLTTTKLGSRVTFSAEAEEESIIAVMPYMRNKIVYAMVDAEENATVNGDTTSTHQDSDVTSSADARKAWKGYRKHAPSGAKVDNAGTNIKLAKLRDVRKAMGVYGYDPTNLAYVVGPAGAIKMLQVEDPMSATNPSPVLTLDKLGPGATIFSGQIASIDGSPIIVSKHIREDLDENGVKLASGTTGRTIVLCVNRPAFVYGDRRAMKVESERLIVSDQVQMVTMRRLTFSNWFPGSAVVGVLRNITV